jgi:hypothetical protein
LLLVLSVRLFSTQQLNEISSSLIIALEASGRGWILVSGDDWHSRLVLTRFFFSTAANQESEVNY